MKKNKIEQFLTKAKLRKTQPRLKILKTLLNSTKPLTQEQITEELGAKAPDKVTVYRCLENFVEAGLVHKAFLQERTWHYELSHHCTDSQCHPHFTCKKCGVTSCLRGKSLPLIKGLKKGFVIHRQQVRLEGLCPKCA